MNQGWDGVVVVLILIAAFLLPRVFARPKEHPWQVWLPAVVAVGAIAYGAATADWVFAALFAVVLVFEVWRTWPVRKRLDGAKDP